MYPAAAVHRNVKLGAQVLLSSRALNSPRRQQRSTASAERAQSISETDKFLHYNAEDGYYKTSPFEPITVPNVPLHQYVWRDFKKWEKKTAAVCVVSDRQYTYAQLRDASAALAVRLQTKFKLFKPDVIAICMPNLPEYPIAALGAIEAALTVTTVNPVYTPDEIARQLTFSDAKLIIGTVQGYATLREACQLAKKDLPIVVVRTSNDQALPPGAVDFAELIRTEDVRYDELRSPSDASADDIVFLPFSSGTTGLPKGVVLSHNNITSNCEQIHGGLTINTLEFQDTLPGVLPFFHIYGLTVVMLSKLGLGCRLATMPAFKPDEFIKSLDFYKGSVLNIVPPIVLFMINHPKLTQEIAPNLRAVMTGAAPIGQHDVERFLKKFPKARFMQGYGMTEASPVVLLTPEGNTRYASTGVLPPNTESKIVPLDGDNVKGLGPRTTGELCVRGPQVMSGYLNNEEANKVTFYPGNWLRTGDVAFYDEEGFFYITDRMKELIKVKGFQVPPAELEAVLRDHPKILEAAVFGIPHEVNGEAPRAIVVLRPNEGATAEEIAEYVAGRVAHYKKLEGGVIFVDEVPKNPTGKILRKDLKAKFSS
ncbi:4-coumarate--CoA ligase 1 [Scaptodrosophila lebanonensis]|uniref:Luciferin 4-monooxygenase n=1 Tax=Drosophila lebanonensis TaxID=7225 RepID=A0A6J2TNB7_DROLE|nr:4-coumarate--CoA ligase 1 [Scaptodrosophila lebanonensis]